MIGDESKSFQWLLSRLTAPGGSDSPVGRCIGTNGVNVVLARAQAALVAKGWVTSRVLAGEQDLSTGVLTLTLVPGHIAAIRLTADSTVPLLGAAALLTTAIPAKPGDLLNLRDIEQGLENLKSVPTAETDIKIEPSTAANAKPGDSDLVVKYVQARKVRWGLTLDDSGTKATGVYQAGATVSLDNPLGLNDLFYFNAMHSVDGDGFSDRGRGTEAQTAHYSVPYGDWLAGFTASNNRYHQSIAGLTQNYIYSGETSNAEAKLSRLLYRDQSRKVIASVSGFRQENHNYVDDAEIDVQRRIVGGWTAGLSDKEFIGDSTLEGNLGYTRGTGAFGAIEAPEDPFGEGTERMKLWTYSFNLNAPFKLDLGGNSQSFRYTGLIRGQWNETPLTPQYRFSIGSRYTVRGFDGESMLMGDHGVLIRNDLGWAIQQTGAELYLGADYGQVGGQSTAQLIGKHLAGAVVGVRGNWSKVGYDFFVGTPLSKPAGFQTANLSGGFSLNVSF
ncbi:TpsB transporter (plasmid) [Variovorax sp. SRS16]|nr:TpsB transporter [Variovorax sp. SRS16]